MDPVPSPSDAEPSPVWLAEVAVFSGIVAMLVADLWVDAQNGQSAVHMEFEAAAIVVSVAGIVWLLRRWTAARRALHARVRDLTAHLSASRADAARWQAEAQAALSGLGAAIGRQFDRWKLTEAEKGVALLLLKGMSLKESAAVRGTTERTVRQQALSVYRKAGLSGRAELSAFFLEDLLLPVSGGEGDLPGSS